MDMPRPAAPPALRAVVAELELHADAGGWDRPPTLYALVDTAELVAAEPALATQLGLAAQGVPPGSLTPVEQEPLGDRPLDEALARIAWPPAVLGCALIQEVLVLPPSAEAAQPAGVDAVAWAASHADRREVRMTVAVLRDGARAAALRVRPTGAGDQTEAAFGEDLAPNLADALLATLD
ncbi:MAG TPA: PPA1309 family protein [Kribbellaceae bacterium]